MKAIMALFSHATRIMSFTHNGKGLPRRYATLWPCFALAVLALWLKLLTYPATKEISELSIGIDFIFQLAFVLIPAYIRGMRKPLHSVPPIGVNGFCNLLSILLLASAGADLIYAIGQSYADNAREFPYIMTAYEIAIGAAAAYRAGLHRVQDTPVIRI